MLAVWRVGWKRVHVTATDTRQPHVSAERWGDGWAPMWTQSAQVQPKTRAAQRCWLVSRPQGEESASSLRHPRSQGLLRAHV